MAVVTKEQIKKLRDESGVSIAECKAALEKTGGDLDAARGVLRAQGASVAAKKSGRTLGAGVIQIYLHGGGTVGAMVELLSETDFVAKNEEFKKLAYDIAMQVAATDEVLLKDGNEILLKEPYIKDPSRTVGDLIQDATQKFGERTELGRVAKFSI